MSLRRAFLFVLLRARIGFWAGLIVVAGLALYPDLTLPEPAATRGFTDKLYHGSGFAVLAVLAGAGWGLRARVISIIVLLAIGLELLQIFSHGRGIFLSDMVANLFGAGLGLLLVWPVSRRPQSAATADVLTDQPAPPDRQGITACPKSGMHLPI